MILWVPAWGVDVIVRSLGKMSQPGGSGPESRESFREWLPAWLSKGWWVGFGVILARPAKIHATFDDPNLMSRAGLVPVDALTLLGSVNGRANIDVTYREGEPSARHVAVEQWHLARSNLGPIAKLA